MNLNDIYLKPDYTQRLYCNKCEGYLDLIFNTFHETVSEINIHINGLPFLYCEKCNEQYLPDDSRFDIIRNFERSLKNGANNLKVSRKKINQNFGFTKIPFIYDSDDYLYIPGLKRPHNKGYLTPVFFKKEVLLKYDASPTYRLSFASTTYGDYAKAMTFLYLLELTRMER